MQTQQTASSELLLQEAEHQIEEVLTKQYVQHIDQAVAVQLPRELAQLEIAKDVRFFDVQKIVLGEDRETLHKLMAVYNTVGNLGKSLVYILHSEQNNVHLYIGVKQSSLENQHIQVGERALSQSLIGQFPGTQISKVSNSIARDVLDKGIRKSNPHPYEAIAAVTGIPSLKQSYQDMFMQGMEKMIDALEHENYTAIFIADPLNVHQIKMIRQGYEELYSSLKPFAELELQQGTSETFTFGENESTSLAETLGTSVGKTLSYTEGTSKSELESSITSINASKSWGKSRGSNISGLSTSRNSGFSLGISKGKVTGSTTGTSTSETTGSTESTNESETNTKTTGTSQSTATGQTNSMTTHYENKWMQNQLNTIDQLLERLETSQDYGLWNTGCYFIADDIATVTVAASTYSALMRGEQSSLESSSLSIWSRQQDEEQFECVKEALSQLTHPHFELSDGQQTVTPTSLINGEELALAFGLPQQSVSGLPVNIEVPFAREVMKTNASAVDNPIKLGHIYHMGEVKRNELQLERDSLSMHTLVVGSTGSGKSNTVYKLLEQSMLEGLHFMVIEPAKGEYKNVFGHRSNVFVYGTNPQKSELLRINPFSFPSDVHVLEHIDRFIEILNVCWPMYAAMPAMLKEAMLEAYESCGWDLETSMNELRIFPNFHDLLEALETVIEQSTFSEEVKSNYSGSLITRVKSLTNGLNSNIFNRDEIPNEDLYDRNVIVDLSRVGSTETKSLIMGILVMKLNEYRASEATDMNEPLKHITVLEEAHHLLKRTSTEQSAEGSNLAGKSVEMLANSIAEMRTYGEGFIIADQSPNALDMAAVRNTNTKIIMRLPEESDRQLVGKSATLEGEQLNAIARLPRGVAAVYQNDWLEPVLCQVDYFDYEEKPYRYTPPVANISSTVERQHLITFLMSLYGVEGEYQTSIVRQAIINQVKSAREKADLLHLLNNRSRSYAFDTYHIGTSYGQDKFLSLLNDLTKANDIVGEMLRKKLSPFDFTRECGAWITKTTDIRDQTIKVILIQLLLKDTPERLASWKKEMGGASNV